MNKVNENRQGYKETKVGWIPSDWECVNYSEAFSRVSLKVDVEPSKIYREIGIRSHGKGIFHKPEVTGESLGDKRVFYINVGALVFNIVFAWEQAVALISNQEHGFIASHRFPMYVGEKDKASESYFHKFFLTPRGKYLLNLASPGGAGRNKTLGQKELNELKLPLPPYSEQKKIAEILFIWDLAIEKLEKLIELKEKRKKGLMQQLLTGKKRLPGFGNPIVRDGDIPEEWKKTPFEKAINRINLKKYTIQKKNYHENGTFPVVDQGKKLIAGYSDKSPVPENQLPLIIFGDHTKEIKWVYFPFIPGADGTIAFKTSDHNNLMYLYFYLSMIKLPDLGYSRHYSELKERAIILPHLDEQNKIANILKVAEDEINNLLQTKKSYSQQKKGLMQKLLTGEVRVIINEVVG